MIRRASAHVRHGLAILLLGAGTVWTGVSFIANFFFSNGSSDGTFPGHPGLPSLSFISHHVNEGLPYCTALYLLGLLFFFVRYCTRYIQTRKLRTGGLSRIRPEMRIFVSETSRLMGIKKRVRVWFSSLVDSPVTLGFLKPVILIPIATANNLTTQQVEAILLHELAHIRRNDYALNLGLALLEVFFFFNPFARLLMKDIKKEREHRCDDLVLQFRYEPYAYASALLSLARTVDGFGSRPRQLAMAATGEREQLLLQRVKRILNQPQPITRPGIRSVVFLLLTLATVFVALSQTSQPHRKTGPDPMVTPIRFSMSPSMDTTVQSFLFQPVPATPSPGFSMAATFRFVSVKQHPCQTPAPHQPAEQDGQEEAATAATIIATARGGNDDPETMALTGEYVVVANAENRAYSMGVTGQAPDPSAPKAADPTLPFVPTSSFTVQCQPDTVPPVIVLNYGEQYKGQTAIIEVERAVRKMQRQLQQQLKALRTEMQMAESSFTKSRLEACKIQEQVLNEQLKLQQQYLQKQQELEKKLQRTGRRIIVYI